MREIRETIDKNLSAYTLDVALTSDDQTVPIEVHNFISCGLYGAELHVAMYTRAYREELRFNGIKGELILL